MVESNFLCIAHTVCISHVFLNSSPTPWHIAGLSNRHLVNAPPFPVVGKMLNRWFVRQLGDIPVGVLVSHNTATDIQFLMCEYLRADMQLPAQIQLGLDTLTTLKRFKSLCYHKCAPSDWPQLTEKGKLSMGVKPCATFALRHRDPPESFEDACGNHHDADADTRAVSVILFDQVQFKDQGLHHCVFKKNKKVFQPLSQVSSAMQAKLAEPVFKFEPTPSGWLQAEVSTVAVYTH